MCKNHTTGKSPSTSAARSTSNSTAGSANNNRANSCSEYSHLSRRSFLGYGAGLMAVAAAPAWLPRIALADDGGTRDVLVSIFLRGGWDGLTVCAPFGDASYASLRPTLAVAAPDAGDAARRAIDLDGFFGLPPALAPLETAYRDGDLLVVHACGLENPTRSHFDAMRFVEVGEGNAPLDATSGWLGRHLLNTAPSVADGVLRAVGIGFGLPRTLAGAPATLPIADLGAFGLAGDTATEVERREALAEMYAHASEALERSAGSTFQTLDLLQRIDFAAYQPSGGADYPVGEFGEALRSAAALLKAEVGVEAVSIDLGGWDTHENQGPFDGSMAQLMGLFASALSAFHEDLRAGEKTNVTVVVMSEFGRNARENGSRGTDHGHGGAMLVLGENVAGGRVLADWPGLAPGQLYEGQDLAITTDYRDVLSEVLSERLGNQDVQAVFSDPSYVPRPLGVLG